MKTSLAGLAGAVLALALGAGPGAAPAATSYDDSGDARVVEGVAIYLGVMPAALISEEYAKGSKEVAMHGGPPAGDHYHHVMIALFDAKTGERITDARVSATVREPGFSETTKELTPMAIRGDLTYGNYFEMPNYAVYRIQVLIRRPDRPDDVVRTAFAYQHTVP